MTPVKGQRMRSYTDPPLDGGREGAHPIYESKRGHGVVLSVASGARLPGCRALLQPPA